MTRSKVEDSNPRSDIEPAQSSGVGRTDGGEGGGAINSVFQVRIWAIIPLSSEAERSRRAESIWCLLRGYETVLVVDDDDDNKAGLARTVEPPLVSPPAAHYSNFEQHNYCVEPNLRVHVVSPPPQHPRRE